MVISTNQSSPPRARQGTVGNIQAPPVLPEQSGSFVPPAASANLHHRNEDLFEIAGCFRCGGNHHEVVCQQRDPWEYIAPFYGSADFGQGFFSIPIVETDAQPVEQMNYAHITVEAGEVTCRDIEHEFNIWADSMQINWRFFAKVVSPTEFRTRFPNAKSIDELAHFGKLFMKTVPGAIIRLVKWTGYIEPISYMEEAWFRIKGIPMKYRCKSTAFYVASMVGKPLALDKNYLRNFSYIRVKIGCQDITMVPSTRIGEIKKAFFEFQFTREMPEASTQPSNQAGVTVDNVAITEQQGTPKRQRILSLDNGSHSAPPRAPGGDNNQHGRQVANDGNSERRRKRIGKDLLPKFAQPTAQKLPDTTCDKVSENLL
jgi:hypothetical protein